MARNDVFLNINALSPADAVVTGQQDMTAATVPELVLGDTPTFNFYFTDNTNVWPSWAGNAAYNLTWALSDAVAGDFSPASTTGNATPITGGWSVILPLNAYDLVGLLNTKRVGQPYPVQNLWQQLRVTDPSGNEITRAMFWTPVRYRAISDTQNTESASPTGGRFVTVNNVDTLTTPTAAQFYGANPVPISALGSAANGELLIGNGTGFTKSTLTAGTGITVTNGSGSITIDATGAQETLTATVKNAESVAITKGQVVYLFGATGNIASVKLAYNTSDATSAKTFGVVSDTSIAPNGTGTVTCVGVVSGLNLGAYQDGDTVYLGASPGSFTATKPYAPDHLVYVGIIERANAGNGELYVRIQNGYELDEIHDVQITAPRQSGQVLIYDNTTSLWKNARITAGSNIAVTNGDGSIGIGFSGTLPVANGGTGVTTSTGSGSVVLSTSPTLTTPILGTPQSGTLTNATGLPISTGVSGLGTNVATALGTNVGSAGSVVVNGGALGTPSSGTLSNATGLPISTGVSGLGTNVATFLATPSSANLASAVTDETGTGALVFANTPTLVTPNIGAATGTSFNLSGSGTLGTTLTVNGTTDSSSKDTGAIITEGGLGVEKSATFGGNVTVSGTTGVTATDLTLGTSGPSVKSTLSARAPRQGLVFDGTAGSTGTLGSIPSGTWTVSAVIDVPTSNPAANIMALTMGIGYGVAGGGSFILGDINSSGELNVSQWAGTYPAYRQATISGFRATYSGKRVHIAAVVTGSALTIYVNGVSTSYTETSGAGAPAWGDTLGSANVFVGKGQSALYYFSGGIYAPLIYNRALSASEVVALYEAGAPARADYASGGATNTSYITGANSTFSSDTGFWTKAFSASIGSGQCTLPSGGGMIYVTGILVKGTKYRLSVNIITNNTSGLYVQNIADIGYGYISGTGVKTFEFTASGSGAANFGLQNQAGVNSIVIDDVTLVPIGLLLAPDAVQAGNGYVWNDQSGNLAQIVLPSSGVQWNLPSVAGQRIRGTTSTNGNQQLLGASVLLPAESQITHVRARARSGTPTITIGTASGGAQIVASVALSTTWLNCTIALTGGIVSSADDIWIGSNSTDVVEIDIAFQPLDF